MRTDLLHLSATPRFSIASRNRKSRCFFLCHFSSVAKLWLLLCLLTSAFAQSVRVQGSVRDASGAAIAGAEVNLKAGSYASSQATDANGQFSFDGVPHLSGTVLVRAKDFAAVQRDWTASSGSASLSLEIVLKPAVSESVVVTATRIQARLSNTAASAVALTASDLSSTPALLPDDKLRQVPGFALFRRSDSATANPTSQGVSLSGLGASGASRALVLQDGIPLNDPFGGWIYWGRIPQQELAGVEVVRGGVSDLYGSNALGGVIQFLSRPVERPAFSLETSYGSERSPDFSFWTGERIGPWEIALAGDLYNTDGYIIIPLNIRGKVDTPANSQHAVTDLTVGRHFGDRTRLFGRGSFYAENRHNGTLIQTNDTRMAEGSLGAETESDAVGIITLRLYGISQGYNQNFSSVAANRNSESLTDRQHVPAQQFGGSVSWSKTIGRLQTLVAGTDSAETMGWSDESLFSSGKNSADTIVGGRQRTAGIYGEDIIHITPKWIVTVGGRFDYWQNFDALSLRIPVSTSGPETFTPFADRSQNAFSPRASVLHPLGSNISLNASIYRAFRSPSLNELYRSFRQGNILTEANAGLQAERLTGAQAGVDAFAFERRLNLRGSFFWDDIVDPIENVTLTTTPALITRQRQNLGRTRSRGMELDAVAHVRSTVEISGGYQFADATVVSYPVNAALVGLRIPEVPRNAFIVQAKYWNPSRVMLSMQGRFAGAQFDDDQNTLLLGRYFTIDLLAGRSLTHGLEAFATVENLLNQRYGVALTPTPTIGPPLLARIGLRLNLPGDTK